MKLIPKYLNPAQPLLYASFFYQDFKDPKLIYKENKRIKNKEFHNLILNKAITFGEKKRNNDNVQNIPFISNKKITLSNAGKDTGVSLSTNMLDSIAKYSKLANLPILEALGLVGQESTFGKGHGKEGYDINPSTLVNDHSYYEDNPYSELFNYSKEKVKNKTAYYDEDSRQIIYYDDYIKALKEGFSYANKKASEINMNEPVLLHAFKKFKSGTYNIKDPNHTSMVKARGEALMRSPEILKWFKNK